MRLPHVLLTTTVALWATSLGCGGTAQPVTHQPTAPAVRVAPDPPPPTDGPPVADERPDPWQSPVALRDNGAGPLPITTRDPVKGPDGALVTVVVFSDFECPACAFYAQYLDEVRSRDPSPSRLVHKHYPLHGHPNARAAAEAATTVLIIGGDAAFWPYYHRLFAEQRALSDEGYLAWAADLGISPERYRAVRARPIVAAKVTEDRSLGEQLGVNATPYVFVNCRVLGDLEGIGQLIAEEHRSAEEAVAAGVLPGHIYEQRCRANLKQPSP